MLNKLEKEFGAITIEATISLSAFMFAIVTILTIVNVCMVQARVSNAINITAKEMSQYSYLYSITGFQKSEQELKNSTEYATQNIDQIMSEINNVFNEVEKLGETGNKSEDNIDAIASSWESIKNIEGAGTSLYDTMENIAKDPKQMIFGIAKLAASETLELGKSRLIAGPLSKVMCKKHLVSSKGSSVDSYLKQLGVVPAANGSYIDGLDFSDSTIFPYGSNVITINVTYKVKVIALLPIDFSFTFNQTAVTHGWLSGETSYQSSRSYVENDTLWTKSTVQERANMIRHMVISGMKDEGYAQTTGLTDVQLYNSETNQFVMISSMNPLWSGEGEEAKRLEDIDDVAIQDSLERLCGKMGSTTDGLSNVTTKTEKDGTTTKKENDCSGATNKIVLVIPEDDGLKEKIDSIIANSNTNGITIEVVQSYGNGASKTVKNQNEEA